MTSKEALSDTIFDYLTVGYAPCNETFTGGNIEAMKSKMICGIYIGQLKRKYGKPIGYCSYFILEYQEGDNVFYEAAIIFNLNDEDAIAYALRVEDGDDYWDDIARQQLAQFNAELSIIDITSIYKN